MTVISISGSSLEEVWGEQQTKPKTKKKSSKSSNDSMCKKPTNYDDIMDYYHPSIHGIYEKSRYSRRDDDKEKRYDEDVYVSAVEDEDISQKLPPRLREYYTERSGMQPHNVIDKEKQYLDLSMFVFSGIALIFILEQFVSIGMAIAKK